MGHFLPISFGLNTKNAPIRSCYVNIALGGLFLAQSYRRGAFGGNCLFVFSASAQLFDFLCHILWWEIKNQCAVCALALQKV